jgi:hypothetical protein
MWESRHLRLPSAIVAEDFPRPALVCMASSCASSICCLKSSTPIQLEEHIQLDGTIGEYRSHFERASERPDVLRRVLRNSHSAFTSLEFASTAFTEGF